MEEAYNIDENKITPEEKKETALIDELNDISNQIKAYMNNPDDIKTKKLQLDSNRLNDYNEIK